MKFVCNECKKTFLYTATWTDTKPYKTHGVFIPDVIIEKQVCPYCYSLDISEYVEPLPKLVSVLSVDLAEVDMKLKEGYEVKELYAKTAVLIKKEGKVDLK